MIFKNDIIYRYDIVSSTILYITILLPGPAFNVLRLCNLNEERTICSSANRNFPSNQPDFRDNNFKAIFQRLGLRD